MIFFLKKVKGIDGNLGHDSLDNNIMHLLTPNCKFTVCYF